MNLREIQSQLPWTVRYSQDFRSNPQTHKDFTHAILHTQKALGKLSALADDMDHDRQVADSVDASDYGKYVADLVVCALRMANEFPGQKIDLQHEVIKRIETKNNKTMNKSSEQSELDEFMKLAEIPFIEYVSAYPDCDRSKKIRIKMKDFKLKIYNNGETK